MNFKNLKTQKGLFFNLEQSGVFRISKCVTKVAQGTRTIMYASVLFRSTAYSTLKQLTNDITNVNERKTENRKILSQIFKLKRKIRNIHSFYRQLQIFISFDSGILLPGFFVTRIAS